MGRRALPRSPSNSPDVSRTDGVRAGRQPLRRLLPAGSRIYRPCRAALPEILAEDPDGVVLNQPTNVAFVGPALDRLAVASLGGWSVMWADVGVTGLPLRHPSL